MFIVDTDKQPEFIDFTPGVGLLRKVPNETDRHDIFNSLAIRSADTIAQHPDFSFPAFYFLE